MRTLDYALYLPLLARLPLILGYRLAALRGWMNAAIGRDWRSVALGTRHVARHSAAGYRILLPDASDDQIRTLVRERFRTESREEFEGRLIATGGLAGLSHTINPPDFVRNRLHSKRGLVLLTPHFDSFTLGIVFLGMSGLKINAMSSAVMTDPRVGTAGSRHFQDKYRGMEQYMNGGRILDRESGLRPFYQMLERRETLVILADAPAADGGSAVSAQFLGKTRALAGGALRMAQKTGSDLGAFVCRIESPCRYRVECMAPISATDPLALDAAYDFLSKQILASPGRWWAADMLPEMPVVECPAVTTPQTEHA